MALKHFFNNKTFFKNLSSSFIGNFGLSRSGHSVEVSVLDNTGVEYSNVTIGSVVELSDGSYGVSIMFLDELNGYVKLTDTTDNISIFIPFLSIDVGVRLGNFVRICRTIDEPYISITSLTES